MLLSLEKQKPDIVLLDIEMPIINGLEALRTIRKTYPGLKVIMLSLHAEEHIISRFILEGANGFLKKHAGLDEVLETIKGVFAHGFYLKPDVSSTILKEINRIKMQHTEAPHLTKQELEVIQLICKDKSHKEIADMLCITVRTVDFHKGNIYQKTNTHSTIGLYKYAHSNGLL